MGDNNGLCPAKNFFKKMRERERVDMSKGHRGEAITKSKKRNLGGSFSFLTNKQQFKINFLTYKSVNINREENKQEK